MRSWSSTAKAGKLMMVRRPASISFELDSRGRRELSFVCVCVCVCACVCLRVTWMDVKCDSGIN